MPGRRRERRSKSHAAPRAPAAPRREFDGPLMAEVVSSSRIVRDRHVLLGIVFLVAYASIVSRARILLSDPDPYAHVAIGRWIIAHRVIPHSDVFSFTMRGAPWVPHEWLADILIAWSYDHLNWAGLALG